MLKPKVIPKHSRFIGRAREMAKLTEISQGTESAIIVMYGRRRIGKTELLEQAFRERNILKFEGIENANEAEQISNMLWQLNLYEQNPESTKPKATEWRDVLKQIADHVKTGQWTLYFEEVQWIASYQDKFIAKLKYFWDNFFRYNSELIMILCGSSPSFIINHVLQSKALYNRSQYEMPLQELNLIEAKELLGKKSNREVMDAYLTVGGVPEYLKRLKKGSSAYTTLCKESFRNGGYFTHEAERIFASSLEDKKYYKDIIAFLSKVKFSTRKKILEHFKLKSSGKFSDMLADLELCGFIKKYTPYNLGVNSMLTRYMINDAYLQFYYKFIQPRLQDITEDHFAENPTSALSTNAYYQWLGFAFERFCRKYHRLFAKILGFQGVNYRSGVFFSRKTDQTNAGFQVDLIFRRDDHVCTLCEIKYLQTKVSTNVIQEVENKIQKLNLADRYSLQKVLITTEGADSALIGRSYFDRIITLDDLFNENNYIV